MYSEIPPGLDNWTMASLGHSTTYFFPLSFIVCNVSNARILGIGNHVIPVKLALKCIHSEKQKINFQSAKKAFSLLFLFLFGLFWPSLSLCRGLIAFDGLLLIQ